MSRVRILKLTIRGGGVLFLVAIIVAGIMHTEYLLPVLGATIIGVISFLDDRIHCHPRSGLCSI